MTTPDTAESTQHRPFLKNVHDRAFRMTRGCCSCGFQSDPMSSTYLAMLEIEKHEEEVQKREAENGQ